MDIIAHRGACRAAPENTIEAIRKAWEVDADGVELDLQLTKDMEIVLMHDDTTERTTGINWKVSKCTLEDIKELDAGAKKGDAWRGTRIPALREVWEEVPEDKVLILDVKCGAEILPVLQREVRMAQVQPSELIFVGMDFDVLLDLKEALPEYAVLWNRGRRWNRGGGSWIKTIGQWISKLEETELDGIGLDAQVMIDDASMKLLQDAYMGVFAWTVNVPKEVERLREIGVNCLATDIPGEIRSGG